MEKIKNLFKTAGTKHGTYSVGMTAIVIAIVVVLNLIVGQLPEGWRNIDVSSTKIYEISDTSKELLKNLDQNVTMKVLAVKEDTDERIRTFLSKYSALSEHISVEWIDPVLHPSALTEYETTEDSIVISSETTGKSTVVSFGDIIVSDMYSYYYTGSASEAEFDGEGQLTSAVSYVTSEMDKKVYRTTGHGEASLSTTISDLMDKNSYTVTELNLLMAGEIPDDCDLLLLNAPTKDLTEDEKAEVERYLSEGGDVMLLLGDKNSTELPNLSAMMKDYGMESVDGYIADPQRCYQGNYYYLFPQLSLSGDLASGISSEMVLLTNAHGLNITDPVRDTITTTSFMNTSDNAYAVTEETQTQGSYALGATAVEKIEADEDSDEADANTEADADTDEADANTKTDADTDEDDTNTEETAEESRFTVISAGSLIDSQITDTFVTVENTTLFMNVVTANFDGVENISIEPKSLAVEYNTVQHAGLFSLAVIFGLPLLILAAGFVVWFKRRRA